jgi:hypothetical protein
MSKYRKGARVRLIGTDRCGAVERARGGCIPSTSDARTFKLLGVSDSYRVTWDDGEVGSHWGVELERAPRRLAKKD